jgi:hypothetical protein
VSEGYKQKEATATRFHLLACLADHTGEHTRGEVEGSQLRAS